MSALRFVLLFVFFSSGSSSKGYSGSDHFNMTNRPAGWKEQDVECYFTKCMSQMVMESAEQSATLCDAGYDKIGQFDKISDFEGKSHTEAGYYFGTTGQDEVCMNPLQSVLCCRDIEDPSQGRKFRITNRPAGADPVEVECYFEECEEESILNEYDDRWNELCEQGYERIGQYNNVAELYGKSHHEAAMHFSVGPDEQVCDNYKRSTMCCRDVEKSGKE